MKIAASYLGKAKNAVHAIQALTIFLGWCLTIAIFTQDGSTDGRTRYFFALVSTLSSTHARDIRTAYISRSAEVLKCSRFPVLVQRPGPRLPDDRPAVASNTEVREPVRVRRHRRHLCHPVVRSLHRGGDVERGGHRGWGGEEKCAGRRLFDI